MGDFKGESAAPPRQAHRLQAFSPRGGRGGEGCARIPNIFVHWGFVTSVKPTSPPVFVDDLRIWGKWRHGASCHLLPNGPDPVDLEALHAFAKGLGLKRQWFQDGRWPHYDLTSTKRMVALAHGAIPIDSRQWMSTRISLFKQARSRAQELS